MMSGKAEELRRAFGGNIAESIGVRAGGDAPVSVAVAPKAQGVKRDTAAVWIELERIIPDPDQPREEFDAEALDRLAESLKTRGQLQPIRVRWDEGQGTYRILCGERRWRAAQRAGLATIAAIIHSGELSSGETLAMQLVENCLREDLRPIEQAKAFKALMESNGWSLSHTARELSLDKATVSKALTLLGLSPELQSKVDAGELPATTAYEVARAPEAVRDELATVALSGATRSEVRAARQQRHRETIRVKAGSVALNLDDMADVESALSEALRLVRKRQRGAA